MKHTIIDPIDTKAIRKAITIKGNVTGKENNPVTENVTIIVNGQKSETVELIKWKIQS